MFGESLFLVVDVMLGLCKSFTKGSLFSLQTVFHDKPGLPPHRELDHAIDLIDESLLLPKHQ